MARNTQAHRSTRLPDWLAYGRGFECGTPEFHSRKEKDTALVAEVDRIGAEPFHAPDPLPPIEADEVQLLCWLANAAEDQDLN